MISAVRGEQIAYPRLLDVTYKQAPKTKGKAAVTLKLPLDDAETEEAEESGPPIPF